MTLIDKLREALSRQTKKTSLKETTEYGSKEKELPVPLMKKRELETIEVEHEFRLLKSDRAKFDYLVYLQTREDSLSPETKQKMLD